MEAQVRRLADKYLKNTKATGDDDLRADCPLCGHGRTFVISLRYGVWTCFACHTGGGIVRLLGHLGLTRKQVDRLVKELNLQPPVSRKYRVREKVVRPPEVTTLPEYILAAYDRCPLQLLEQGFTEETLRQHDVGYDQVHDRITFPIRDYMGRLVAISGRACEDGAIPRYKVYDTDKDRAKNGTGGELCDLVDSYRPANREHLYGYDEVFPKRFYKPTERGPLIIVEGFKARMWLRQLGFEDVVALMGYSLTRSQRLLLGKLRGPYYVMLDHEPGKSWPDERGYCAAVKISEHLFKLGRTYLCLYPGWTDEDPYTQKPNGTSPDDLTREEVDYMVKNAKTLAQLATRTLNTAWKRENHASQRISQFPQEGR